MFKDKKILVLGVANELSIAWGIAEELHRQGAEIALAYAHEAIERRIKPLAERIGSPLVLRCDVQADSDLDALFSTLKQSWGRLDGVVHSIAYAERADLQGSFSNTSRSGFHLAMDVSVYSLIAVARRAKELMSEGGALITLTYLGSERVVPNYNVMGVAKAALECSVRYLAADLGEQDVRVNAISAGPIKTLAASAIPQFKGMLSRFAEIAPLKRNVTQADVAQTALYLLGPLSSGVTGEVLYVDCGFSRMGIG